MVKKELISTIKIYGLDGAKNKFKKFQANITTRQRKTPLLMEDKTIKKIFNRIK